MNIAALAMNPSGTMGRLFGIIMEWINTPAYRTALQTLKPSTDEHILEIGFGTGKFAELLLDSDASIHVAGIDPSDTMVSVARSRRGVRAAKLRADLREGDASVLPWPNESFDAVVAIHCFQFWPDPRQSLSEICRVLTTPGRMLLILRDHVRRATELLPNPISRSKDEVEETVSFLEKSGFAVKQFADIGSSHILLATLSSK